MPPITTCGINSPFGELSPTSRQIAHVLRTLTPLDTHCIAATNAPSDLHVLSTPPAFVLSQNQTLRKKTDENHRQHHKGTNKSFQSLHQRALNPLVKSDCSYLHTFTHRVCSVLFVIFEIKDLTYNAQFNFCFRLIDCSEFALRQTQKQNPINRICPQQERQESDSRTKLSKNNSAFSLSAFPSALAAGRAIYLIIFFRQQVFQIFF